MENRNNKQIWRIAKFLRDEFRCDNCETEEFDEISHVWWYDQALKFLKKITNNEFTGPDNHED